MIKINLLNSVTDRQSGAMVAVDRKISSATSRFALMLVVVFVLLGALVGWDVISSQMAKTEAERQLNEQKQVATELDTVMNEQKDLEQKINNIDTRIDAIKKLRSSQAGPSAVLDAMRERVAMTPGLYLQAVEQAGESLILKGNSPDESQVTDFGRSLEFSNGLFSNLNIETSRSELVDPNAPSTPQKSGATKEPPKLSIVNFTIRCSYTPSKASTSGNSNPANASAQAPAAQAPHPLQVASK
jgi:Tfp pilus assembly protein PilN